MPHSPRMGRTRLRRICHEPGPPRERRTPSRAVTHAGTRAPQIRAACADLRRMPVRAWRQRRAAMRRQGRFLPIVMKTGVPAAAACYGRHGAGPRPYHERRKPRGTAASDDICLSRAPARNERPASALHGRAKRAHWQRLSKFGCGFAAAKAVNWSAGPAACRHRRHIPALSGGTDNICACPSS